jgi:phage terminase large subunit GpA-like protein
MSYAEALGSACRNALRSWAPRPELSLAEWAAKHFVLPRESSYREGRFTPYPFQVGLLDVMGNPWVKSVALRKAARLGFTKCFLACVSYAATHLRSSQVVYQPRDEDAQQFSRTEISPMIRDMAEVFDTVAMPRSRDARDTMLHKSFLGSNLWILGATSPASFRRISPSFVHFDEVDGAPSDVGGEGSPVALARKRLEGATFPKFIVGSTPKLTATSHIEREWRSAQARFEFYVDCPKCDVPVTLRWDDSRRADWGFKWSREADYRDVGYACPHCLDTFNQDEYAKAEVAGRWMDEQGVVIGYKGYFYGSAGERVAYDTVALHLSTFASPMVRWDALVRDFDTAADALDAGDSGLMKTFRNTTLGLPYSEEQHSISDVAISQRAEPYPLLTAPRGVLEIAVTVDVQLDRWEYAAVGFGVGEESWVIGHGAIYGDPNNPQEWGVLDQLLKQTYVSEDGFTLTPALGAIDTGGLATQLAYEFCRTRQSKWFALKGSSQPSAPVNHRSSLVDINFQGKQIKRGVRLFHVGVNTAKDMLWSRLNIKKPGPGYLHFSTELPSSFYMQLTAEVRTLKRNKQTGRQEFFWQQIRQRNEALDLMVYAMWASQHREWNKRTPKQWADRRQQLIDAARAPVVKPPLIEIAPTKPNETTKPKSRGLAPEGWHFE